MKYKIIEKISNYKNIAIVGFGLEGQSTYYFIRKYLPNLKLTIVDFKSAYDILMEIKEDIFTQVVFGDDYLNDLEKYDLIFKSPGVSFKNLDKEKISEKHCISWGRKAFQKCFCNRLWQMGNLHCLVSG